MSDTENILRKVLDKITKEHDFGNFKLEIKPVNSGGANYTSVLYLVTLKCPEKDVELFAKVACMGDYMREVVGAKRMYELEVFFYTELIKVYQALELKATIEDCDKFIVPKFYGCDTKLNEETVVLQNMVAEGYGPYDRLISLDWEHAASSIQELAKFHALSFAYQKENPTEYEEVCKELVFVEMKNDDPKMKETWEKQYIPRSLNVVREEHRPRILKLLERLGDDVVWRFKKPLGVKVICHGDFRPSNLLYKRKVSSSSLPYVPL
ncbi:hypothetical protein O0L34_g8032 [Tuta absoluta]|nr:hypothetical protein O0L34_g8032 [Tuta absoluta]